MVVQLESRVLSYYRRTSPLLDRLFGPIPVIGASFPNGYAQAPVWHRAVPLTRKSLLWLCQHEDAIEFYSWAPTAADPERVRFATLILEADSQAVTALPRAMHALHEIVEETRAVAVPLVTGSSSAALWIPFADAPEYTPVCTWLREICNETVRRKPQLFTTEPNSHNSRRIHLYVGSNVPGRFTTLPYSVRGDDAQSVCVPLQWSEVDTVPAGSITLENIDARLEEAGEVFEPQFERLSGQRFSQVRHVVQLIVSAPALAPKRNGASATPERRQASVDLPDDPWPALRDARAVTVSPDTRALVERLKATAMGRQPADFEIAVCDAFAHVGFSATHMGGAASPAGYADALLGPLGYRAVLECRSSVADAHACDAAEASRYREAYSAQYYALIAPSYSESAEFASELRTHRVSAWTVYDLVTLLESGSNAQEMRALFEPGFAADGLRRLLWERDHGRSKRIALVCEYLRHAGFDAQIAAQRKGPPESAPALDEDAAMALVDQQLAECGSSASCTRDDVRAAFEYLTSPMVGGALWVDAEKRDAVVILP